MGHLSLLIISINNCKCVLSKINNSNFTDTALIVLCAILLLCLLGWIAYCAVSSFLVSRKIKKHSTISAEISKVNDEYRHLFYQLESMFTYKKQFKTKAAFDRFKYESILEEYCADKQDIIKEMISKLRQNRDVYFKYCTICKHRFDARSTEWYENHDYTEKEREIMFSTMLKPVLKSEITIICEYISPRGRSFYREQETFPLESLEKVLANIVKKAEYEQSKKYQRSLMTEKLRYEILKRDGFKCVLCGATASEGAKLHVDHIFPIAKGGKTEPSNLRTLCSSCNSGKSDSFDPYGPN